MNTTRLPDHLSYSSISTYLQCPLKWRFHYVDKLTEEFVTSSLVFGQAIHESVAAFLNASLSGDSLTPDEMLMVYLNSWRESKGLEIRCSNGDSQEKLIKKAEDLLTLWHGAQDGMTEVLGVEEEFTVDMAELDDDPSLDLPPLIGYVDHIVKQPDGTIALIDLKTAARKPSQLQADQSLQLTAYSLGAAAMGFDPDELTLRLDYLLKGTQPDLVSLETTRSEDDRRRFVRMVTRVWKGITNSVFFPKTDWFCRSSCGYQTQCAEW
jgi:putative RecB family exonuclease